MAMEPTSSNSEVDPYYAQDDVSEALRRSELMGKDTAEDNPWYDDNMGIDLSEDGS